MAEPLSSPTSSPHVEMLSDEQRGSSARHLGPSSFVPSAESTAVTSADPVTIVDVHNALHSDASDDSKEAAAAAASAAPSDGRQLELTSPSQLKKQTSAAEALALNRTPITITWRDVNVVVDLPEPSFFEKRRQQAPAKVSDESSTPAAAPATQKTILSNASGYCKPGQLLAIMGSSGAGKTSLLNLLAGRFTRYGGEVLLNGQAVTMAVRQHCAFVQQQDLFFKELTVHEHLQFQALLRLGDTTTAQEREERVEGLLLELGLTDVTNTRIGEVGEGGISGGERRRLSFATELLGNPSLVFLDEPTSGLDSFLAESVVSTLKAMARNGRTLVCTIHQPSSEVYALFDQVCYLARGQVAYFGTRTQALEYFSSTLGMQCPLHSNPSDFIIKQLSIIPSDPEKSRAKIGHILDCWSASKYKAHLESDITDVARDAASHSTWDRTLLQDKKGRSESKYATGFLTQTRGIMWRSGLSIMRDKMLTKARAGQTIIMSIVIGLIYLRLGNSQTDVQNRVGAVFLMIMNQSMGSLFGILNMFAAEMPIYQREHRAGLYSSYSFYIARSIAEIPTQIIWPFLFVTITYWLIGLNDSGARYIEFALALTLTANAAMSLGYALAIGAPSVQVALALGMPIILPFILFGGLFINVNDIPKSATASAVQWPSSLTASQSPILTIPPLPPLCCVGTSTSSATSRSPATASSCVWASCTRTWTTSAAAMRRAASATLTGTRCCPTTASAARTRAETWEC